MARASGVWALGDYPKVARELVAEVGPLLVEACGIGPGRHVLDVAAGAGNVAIPAARAGADVVASDITPELLEAGREAAAEAGVALEWREGDAQALPFGDDSFDVVVSSFGVMFAPDQRATAAELTRVCRPGGTIGLANWTPQSWTAGLFRAMAPFAPPPPPGFTPPAMWGDEDHLRELLGDRVAGLRTERRIVVADQFSAPAAVIAFFSAYYGPVVAARMRLASEPDALAELDRALDDFGERTNLAADGTARYELEFLLAVARVA